MAIRFTIMFMGLLLLSVFSSAQLTLTAEASARIVGKNDQFSYRVFIQNASNPDQINPPSFKNFNIISGPIQQKQIVNINGQVIRQIGLMYILQPKYTGEFTLLPATARADGQELTSNAVTLKVTDKVAQMPTFPGMDNLGEDVPIDVPKDLVLKGTEDVLAKMKKNIFVRVETSKKSCFVGEPIVATYKLYTRLESDSRMSKSPSFSGFSVFDLPQLDLSGYQTEHFEGRDYNVYILRKTQLYPLQPGKQVLESAEVDNTVLFVKSELLQANPEWRQSLQSRLSNGLLPREALQQEKFSVSSVPVELEVLPLPAKDVPESFKGAVGQFELMARIEKEEFTTDDAGKLIVTIRGAGNLPLLTAPSIPWPAGVEAFEPELKDNENRLNVPVSGDKTFTWSFTAGKPGSFSIPPIAFSYFNPAEQRYVTLKSDSIRIVVSKGTGKSEAVSQASIQESFGAALFSNRFLIVIPIAFFIIAGLFFWVRKENRKEAAQDKAAALPTVSDEQPAAEITERVSPKIHPLEKSMALLPNADPAAFYPQLNREVKQWLASRLQMDAHSITIKSMLEEMERQGFSSNLQLQASSLYNEIEWQLYTPLQSTEEMERLLQRSQLLMEALEQQG